MLGGPARPAIDAAFTTAPGRPSAISARAKACRTISTPITFTSSVARTSSIGASKVGAKAPCTPALLNSRS
jgi:hypothetical protein